MSLKQVICSDFNGYLLSDLSGGCFLYIFYTKTKESSEKYTYGKRRVLKLIICLDVQRFMICVTIQNHSVRSQH